MNKSIRDKIFGEGREYRDFTPAFPAGEKIVEGYATTFNDPYLLWTADGIEFWEQVDAHAFDKCDMSDVIMQYDHEGRVFARMSNGTLTLQPDDHGLFTRADLGGTELGAEIYNEIAGGYTKKMSMGFIVREERTEIDENKETGVVKVLRTILDISKLFDVSAVSLPANEGTSISARHYVDGAIDKVRQELAARHERERQRQRIKILLEAIK